MTLGPISGSCRSERHAGAPTSGDCDSSSSDENDRLSVRSRSPLPSVEGLQDDTFAPGSLSVLPWT